MTRCLDARAVALRARAMPAGRRGARAARTARARAGHVRRARRRGVGGRRRSTASPDGTFSSRTSATPHGQGHDMTFAAIAADRLRVGIDDVSIALRRQRRGAPRRGHVRQPLGRGGRLGGRAGLRRAARAGAGAGRATLLEVDRAARAPGRQGSPPARGAKLLELAAAADGAAGARQDVRCGPRRAFPRPTCSPPAPTGRRGDRPRPPAPDVTRLVAVDDAGTLINPLLAHGQVIGGAVQGLGECLTEEVHLRRVRPERAAPR